MFGRNPFDFIIISMSINKWIIIKHMNGFLKIFIVRGQAEAV